jgi:hypothetical protein
VNYNWEAEPNRPARPVSSGDMRNQIVSPQKDNPSLANEIRKLQGIIILNLPKISKSDLQNFQP